MLELAATGFFFGALAILAVTGFAMTFVTVTKANNERISKLEQESALRAAVYGQMAVKRELKIEG